MTVLGIIVNCQAYRPIMVIHLYFSILGLLTVLVMACISSFVFLFDLSGQQFHSLNNALVIRPKRE
jgi:predicted membrane metal-binding protein